MGQRSDHRRLIAEFASPRYAARHSMGHFIKGLVAARDVLVSFASDHGLRTPIPLEQGFALLPLLDDDLDAMIPAPQTGHVELASREQWRPNTDGG